MKNQRGVIAPVWLYLAGVLALIVATTALVAAWNSFTASLIKEGYDKGVAETTVAYQKRDNAQLAKVQARVKELESLNKGLELKWATKLASLEKKRLNEVQNAKDQADRDIADIRAGNIRLRAECTTRPVTPNGDRGEGSTPSSPSGSSDGGTTSYLSEQVTEFLLDQANQADDITRQLGAAQEVIKEYYNMCGG